jgi:hypothetical protein
LKKKDRRRRIEEEGSKKDRRRRIEDEERRRGTKQRSEEKERRKGAKKRSEEKERRKGAKKRSEEKERRKGAKKMSEVQRTEKWRLYQGKPCVTAIRRVYSDHHTRCARETQCVDEVAINDHEQLPRGTRGESRRLVVW